MRPEAGEALAASGPGRPHDLTRLLRNHVWILVPCESQPGEAVAMGAYMLVVVGWPSMEWGSMQ